MQLRRTEHLITAAVALGATALALAEGGFPPTAVAATGLIVWAAVLLGLATGVFPRVEPPKPATVAGLCLAGYAALIAISMAWASDNGGAYEDVIRALAYLGILVLVVIASPRDSAGAWLRGLAIGLAAVAAIALLARFEPGPFGHPDADLAETVPSIVGRLTYPVGYWNGLAALMAAGIALLTWLATSGGTRIGRALASAALPVLVLALWMTGSRGGAVAAAIAAGVLLFTHPQRTRLLGNLALGILGGAGLILAIEAREELLNAPTAEAAAAQGDQMLAITLLVAAATGAVRYLLDGAIERLCVPRRAALTTLVVIAVAAVVGLVAVNPIEQFDEFREPPTAEELASGDRGMLRGGGSGRWQFWETATQAFEEAPVAGVGASGFTPYWLEHREYPLVAKRAHSVLFETLAELGILGLALIGGFFGATAWTGIGRWRESRDPATGAALAVFTIGLAAAIVDWTWDVPAVFLPTVLAAAVLTGAATLRGNEQPTRVYGEVRSRRRFARGVAVLLVAWASICASGLLLLSDHALTSSRAKADDADLAGAIDSANDAVDLEPWASDPRAELATLYEFAGDLASAREAIDGAIARNEDDWELYLIAARIAHRAGDSETANAFLDRAAELNPLARE